MELALAIEVALAIWEATLWFLEGPAWAAQIMGIVIEERRLRAVEHECLDDYRAKGLIR